MDQLTRRKKCSNEERQLPTFYRISHSSSISTHIILLKRQRDITVRKRVNTTQKKKQLKKKEFFLFSQFD